MEKLKSALVLVALAGAATGGMLMLAKTQPTKTDIRISMADAGCTPKAFTCTSRIDAGKYAAMQVAGWECPDGKQKTTIFASPLSELELVADDCHPEPCVDGGVCDKPFLVFPAPFPCAWRPADAGVRTCLRVDGGDPGAENTMQPGQWAGKGCVRKACVEIAGESSAP